MGAFDGIQNTKLFDRGVYLSPDGDYELEVKKMLLKQTRKSGLGFIVEFKIIESTHPAHTVGSSATWFQGMNDQDIAFAAIKEFMVALLDVDRNDAEAMEEFNNELTDMLEEATAPIEKGEEHTLAGYRVHCQTYLKKTQRGLDFTVHNFTPSEHAEAAE